MSNPIYEPTDSWWMRHGDKVGFVILCVVMTVVIWWGLAYP